MATAAQTKKATNSVEITFSKEKETPGTWRYKEDAEKDKQVIGILYVKKPLVEKLGSPDVLKVTLEVAAPPAP